MSDGDSVAVELAEMRGCMETGFANIEGSLKLVGDRVARTQEDVSKVDTRVKSLEDRRWPLASIGILSGSVSAVVAVVPFMIR